MKMPVNFSTKICNCNIYIKREGGEAKIVVNFNVRTKESV